MTTATQNQWEPQAVVGLLERQERLVGRLEDLSARQRKLVCGDDMEPLLGLLADRQRVCGELTDVTRDLSAVRRAWSQIGAQFDSQERDAAEKAMASAGTRLRRLMEVDDEDARKLSIRKQSVTQTLHSAGAAERALSAYQSGPKRAPRLDCTDART